MRRVGTALLLNGLTAAVADVALNDLSRHHDLARRLALTELKPYFARHGILQAASYAAITVVLGAAVVLASTRLLFGFDVPTSSARQVAACLCVSFVVGWLMDVAIFRMRVFPGLDAYYARHGAGFWGAASLVVSMSISLLVQGVVLPHLS